MGRGFCGPASEAASHHARGGGKCRVLKPPASVMPRRFSTRWVSLREASRFIAQHHRHHNPPQGGIVALGLWEGAVLVGVGVIGRPVSRELQKQGVGEITRLCVQNDVRHGASALAGACRRLGQSLGFARLVTYTLPEEGGASLRAAGFQPDIELAGGGEGTRPSRPRPPADYPTARKVRWWGSLKQQKEIEFL